MINQINEKLEAAPVVPLVSPDDVDTAIRTTEALVSGGLTVIEVVLRTPAALHCLGEIARAVPEAIVGAGTVLSEQQVDAVLEQGAHFIVAPGFYEPVVRAALSAGAPIYPGVSSASEAQAAWNMGLRTLKFFPASLCGGTAMIKALGSVFRDVRFMPTGGISTGNLAEYLALPNVLACGGSWLTPKAAIEAGEFETITRLSREALAIADTVRD